MKIAFDLDNTLIQNVHLFPTERPEKQLFAKLFRFEELREGTTELFHFCQQQNWKIWIYTTSFRSPLYIRRLFWLYGIRLQGIVNQEIHDRHVKVRCSKYPPAFGLDVLIDDSEGVRKEAEKYQFHALCIQPENTNWVDELKIQLLEIHKSRINPTTR